MTIYSSDLITTAFNTSPSRVVCLVPSTTESFFAFGLGERLVGVTDFCPLNEESPESPERVGGTKTPDVKSILNLNPDLIIANQEENNQIAVKTLAAGGIPVWLSFPRSVEEAIGDLWILARIFNKERQLATRLITLERSIEWTRLAFLDQPRLRYFCPLWKGSEPEWWMTFNQKTYAHDILAICGGENVFSNRERKYPLEAELGDEPAEEPQDRDVRYPRVGLSEIIAAQPQLILLPSEPYAFNSDDVRALTDQLTDTPAISTKQIYLIDGRLVTWHGIKMAEGINTIPRYFQAPVGDQYQNTD